MGLGLALALIASTPSAHVGAARGSGRLNVRMTANICPLLPPAVQSAQSQTATFAQG